MKNIAKNITLAILVLAFLIGGVGAFLPTFNFDGYTTFLKGFSLMFGGLVASIGINSGIEKVQDAKDKEKGK